MDSASECGCPPRERCYHNIGCAVVLSILFCWYATKASGQSPPVARSFEAITEQPALKLPAEVLPQPEPKRLSLSAVEQMALSSNPSLSRAAALIDASRGTWQQVGLQRNPSVGYEGQQLGSGGLAEQHGVLFEQEIVRPGKLRLNREVASQDVSIAEQNLTAQRMRVLTDVRIAFYQTLVAQKQIQLADEIVRISREGSQAAD